MPRYYFRLDDIASDIDGEELPNDQAALDLAVAIAKDLSMNKPPSHFGTLVVTNEDGLVLHKLELTGGGAKRGGSN